MTRHRTLAQQLVRALLILVALGGLVLSLGPDLTPSLDQRSFEQQLNPAVTSEEKYVLRSIDVDVTLSRDDDGYSVLTTDETIVAVFDAASGSRGITRYLVDDFDKHQTRLEIVSVTDGSGNDLDYTVAPDTDLSGRYLAVSIMGDEVLSGDVTYRLSYIQHEVTTQPDGPGGADELLWSSMGYWKQPAASVAMRFTVDPELRDAMTSTPQFVAFASVLGDRRPFDPQPDGSGTAGIEGTLPGNSFIGAEVQFDNGTFTPSPVPTAYYVSVLLPYAPIAVALLLFIGVLATRATRWRDASGRGTIIAQYEALPGVNLMQAGGILGRGRTAVAAQLVDLAVRGSLRIRDLPPGAGNLLGREGAGYEFEFVTSEGLDEEERSLVATVFGSAAPRPGTTVRLVNSASQLRLNIRAATLGVLRRSIALGYREIPRGMGHVVFAWAPIAAASLQWGFYAQAYTSLSDEQRGFVLLVAWGATALAAIAWTIAVTRYPLTKAGALVKEHLLGMREYIELAEADRLRVLQSVGGADRVDGTVKLNERMLPYAVLFGAEASWASRLAINDGTTAAVAPAWLQ